MQVDVKIDSTVDEMKILVIADKEGHTVDTFVDYIRDYERKQVTKLMAYKGDTAYLINISDILRIYAGNQKVFVETQQNEYIVRYRLYELEELLEKKTFLLFGKLNAAVSIRLKRVFQST
ncbi:LytTR family transcriptional regulator DNA-binding domain-containing protein [Mediterraneibacter gnavus]|uniref:LytTR family transcriptional regulator DNA-binding domain-containing protein n=1 Tax=Mediterraneibacter gnavus TaxID=33038 RepID=UPI001897D766|nr:LytTR family transcriptional regulator DNA-binding domain-containing protein [Mediterraneibacter gnavus]